MAVAVKHSRGEAAAVEKLRRVDDVRKEGGRCGSRRIFSPSNVEAFVQWFAIRKLVQRCFDLDLL